MLRKGAAAEGDAEDATPGQVTAVTHLRFLPGATPATVRDSLEREYGTPLEHLRNEVLVWVGRDPDAEDGKDLVELRSQFTAVAAGGPGREPGVLLALTINRFDPRAAERL